MIVVNYTHRHGSDLAGFSTQDEALVWIADQILEYVEEATDDEAYTVLKALRSGDVTGSMHHWAEATDEQFAVEEIRPQYIKQSMADVKIQAVKASLKLHAKNEHGVEEGYVNEEVMGAYRLGGYEKAVEALDHMLGKP